MRGRAGLPSWSEVSPTQASRISLGGEDVELERSSSPWWGWSSSIRFWHGLGEHSIALLLVEMYMVLLAAGADASAGDDVF